MMLKVMTFNIRGTNDSIIDGVNGWENRRDLNLATIQKYAPDVVGFQEAQHGNMETYRKSLTAWTAFRGLAATRHHRDEYTPIYWKTSRFDLIASGQFYLSPTPQRESLGWDATLVRVAAWVRLREVAARTEFFVLNTHFPHETDAHATRQHCARLIIEQVNAHAADLPLIVMGDFNAQPDSAAYRSFLDAGLADTYAVTGAAPVNTFHNFKGADYPAVGEHIDWILTRHFRTDTCQVITDAAPPLFPSDHYPVLAQIAFGG